MIDTHCHIDDPVYSEDLRSLVALQQQAGVSAIVVPGVDVRSIESVPEVCNQFPDYLYPALGLHPEEVREDYACALARIYNKVQQLGNRANRPDGLVAIGEIGLDYHFSVEFRAEQQQAFRTQLLWAHEFHLPVIIHARDSIQDVMTILREVNSTLPAGEALQGVFHCFSGSYEIATELVRMGWYLGIGGVLTFKNCKLGQTLVPQDGRQRIPLDRLLLETDGPYMAPVPHRGKTNESRFMIHVVDYLAQIYECTQNDIISVTNRSAKSLFGLK